MHTFSIFSPRTTLLALALAGGMLDPSLARTGSAAAPAPSAAVDSCLWDRPGHNPFMGDVVAAVDRYQDIPNDVRQRLKERMARRAYDDVVSIRRDSITGSARYGSAIRDMHFGNRQVCHSVSRSAWSAQMHERGLVYCDSGQCILVPTICRNVSRIARAEVGNERAEGEAAGPEEGPVVSAGPALPATMDVGPTSLAMDTAPSFAAPLGSTDAGGSFAAAGIAAASAGPGAGGSGAFVSSSGSPTTRTLGAVSEVVSGVQVEGAVAAVPEPETWGLMLGGLAAIAALRRRKVT